jgi:hypothetical protein
MIITAYLVWRKSYRIGGFLFVFLIAYTGKNLIESKIDLGRRRNVGK